MLAPLACILHACFCIRADGKNVTAMGWCRKNTGEDGERGRRRERKVEGDGEEEGMKNKREKDERAVEHNDDVLAGPQTGTMNSI